MRQLFRTAYLLVLNGVSSGTTTVRRGSAWFRRHKLAGGILAAATALSCPVRARRSRPIRTRHGLLPQALLGMTDARPEGWRPDDCCCTMTPAILPGRTLVRAGRVFVSLRKSGRVRPGREAIFHAVTPYCRMALCADEPGAGSVWAEPPAEHVTCAACLSRLARLENG
jgi:hypothetical protein